jgi:hypothetical protein
VPLDAQAAVVAAMTNAAKASRTGANRDISVKLSAVRRSLVRGASVARVTLTL